MNNKRHFLGILLAALFFSVNAFADVITPVKWNNSLNKINEDTYEIIFEASIDKGWHLYGLNIPDGGPIATSFIFDNKNNIQLIGGIQTSVDPETKFDNTFEMNLELFDGKVTFTQKLKKIGESASISGIIEFMACDDSRCLPPSEIDFSFSIGESSSAAKEDTKAEEKETPFFGTQKVDLGSALAETEPGLEEGSLATEQIEPEKLSIDDAGTNNTSKTNKGLLAIFLISILGGLGALLTPCVYPMIPLTVSFFMRDDKSRGKSITEAFVFGASIILIYTSLGILVAIFKDPNAISSVSSHWIPNLLFFVIFIALAVSFFGVFEIVLPSSVANKVDQKADKGGIIGAFFMALGMTILSFSCTGPIVASLLIKAAQGEVFEPVVGMFGFGFAFALPFTLLAIFPSVISKLPKSGGWMNAVKVFFAFILLAFALMFLSNIGLSFITRDIVLALDIVIFALLGFYLLGKIKFSHDSELKYISVPRLVLAILSFTVAVYLVPGLFGSPLKAISPFLPPAETSEFRLNTGKSTTSSPHFKPAELCDPSPKYSENPKLHIPEGLHGYFDYDEALACANRQNKPLLIDFVGHSCKNCKKMYAEVWSDKKVKGIINDNYVLVVLYTDDRTKLPEDEWITSTIDGKIKNTMGKKNVDFEISKFGSNALPLYAIVDTKGEILTSEKYYTYNLDISEFIDFLEEGVRNFNN